MLTQAMLKTLLDYNTDTGIFSWTSYRKYATNARPGRPAGCTAPDGYHKIQICGHTYLAHRLAWFYVHGVWPKPFIDHINGIRNDNRIDNLRCASRRENNTNRKFNRETGQTGIYYDIRTHNWSAHITINYKKIHLGVFLTKEEAQTQYNIAAAAAEKGESVTPIKRLYRGTSYHKQRKKWRACITVDQKQIHLGLFLTEQEAHEAYLKAYNALKNKEPKNDNS